MDTDASSQDASASSISPHLRPERHTSLDSSRTAPIHSTFAGPDTAPLFFHGQAGSGNQNLVDEPGLLIAPTLLLSRSNPLPDGAVRPARSPASSPEIPPQISVCPELKPCEQAVQDMPHNGTPRPSGDVASHHDALTTPLIDPAPSTSSDPCVLWRTQSLPEDSTSATDPPLPPLSPRHSASLPPSLRLTTERGLRLSPSVVIRQPIPLLNLPALPPSPPPAPGSPPSQRVPLRSMPSLSRYSYSNAECQADHEDATLEGSDDDDCDEEEFTDALSIHQSDDEDDEPPSAGPSGSQEPKSLQKQRMKDDQHMTESSTSPVSPQSDFAGRNIADHVCSRTNINTVQLTPSPNALAMYPLPLDTHNTEDVTHRLALDPDPRLERRPSLYRVASRSMINLVPARRAKRGLGPLKHMETAGTNPESASGRTTELDRSQEIDALLERLRRRSMPSYHPTSDPPPYPTFNPRPKEARVASHQEEGPERLPSYSNSLYLIAIMPRKMEFSSPGVQARDRKWRRVVCELEGTTFRIYTCPPGTSGAGALGEWWEKRVGVGDMACPNPPRTRKKGPGEQSEWPTKLGIDEPPAPVTSPSSSSGSTSVPPARRGTALQASMSTQSTMTSAPQPAKRVSAASFLSPFRSSSSSTTRLETNTGESPGPESREPEVLPVGVQDSRSSSHESVGRATPTPVAQRLSQPPQFRSASRFAFLPVATWRSGEIPKPPKSYLLRAYTLQHGESGLGNDYLKRKNVIRVRLEGEQFLLQAPDIPAVVEWIEVHCLQIW